MSFPHYTEYRGSGVEWLGDVPNHWEAKPIKRIVLFSNAGEVIDRSYWGGDSELLYTCAIDPLQCDYSGFPEAKRTSSRDLLVTRNGTPYVHKPEPGSIYTNVVQRIRLKSEASRDFVALALQNSANNLKGYGVSIESLNYEMWRELVVPLPSLDEQAAIVSFLDHETAKIDALVAEQEKLIALLKEKRQAVISHAVTKGLNPDAPMKDSGVEWLGEVPAHWDVAPMKYMVKLQSGGTPSKDKLDYWAGDIPWASAKDMKVDRLVDTEDHITAHAIEEGAAAMVPAGSVVVVVRGMILARTFPVALTMCEITINQDLKAIRCCDRLYSGFFAWYLRGTSEESLCRLDEAGHGTKALRMDAWTSMEVTLPPLAEQQEIAEFVEASCARFDALIDEAGNAMDLLKERRSALISAAVTGKIDVRGLGAKKEAA